MFYPGDFEISERKMLFSRYIICRMFTGSLPCRAEYASKHTHTGPLPVSEEAAIG